MMTFSILIPIHNRLNITRQGLSALLAALEDYTIRGKGQCRFEVVVIDDGSTDGSSEWISANCPSVRLLHGDGDLWWSGAINKGAAYAIDALHSDYLLLWNDDIFPEKHFFSEVERIFMALPEGEIVIGSKIMYKELEDRVWSIGGYFNKKTGRHGMYDNPGMSGHEFFECDWLPGMGTFVSASIIKRYNLWWDEKRFPQYHGDSDFTLSCKEKGIRVATCLSFVIYNHAEAYKFGKANSFRDLWVSLISKRSNYNVNMRLLFYKKHGSTPFAYRGLLKSYFIYIAAFLKNKIARG